MPFLKTRNNWNTRNTFKKVLLANFGSAALLRKGQRRLAMVLLVPFVIVASVLAYIVITQDRPGA